MTVRYPSVFMALLCSNQPLSPLHRRVNQGTVLILALGGIALGLWVAKNCAALTSGYAADYDYAIAFFIAVILCILGLPLLIYWRTRWVGAGLIAAGILSYATFYVGMVILLKEDRVAWPVSQKPVRAQCPYCRPLFH